MTSAQLCSKSFEHFAQFRNGFTEHDDNGMYPGASFGSGRAHMNCSSKASSIFACTYSSQIEPCQSLSLESEIGSLQQRRESHEEENRSELHVLDISMEDLNLPTPSYGVSESAHLSDLKSFRRQDADVSSGHFKHLITGRLPDAFQAIAIMDQQGSLIPTKVLFSLLQRCIQEKDEKVGVELSLLMGRGRYSSDPFLACWLIRMLTVFAKLSEANAIFTRVLEPSVFTWSAIISAHAKLGHPLEALHLYNLMKQVCQTPDAHAFAAALKSCADMEDIFQGTKIHIDILEAGLESDAFVGNTLLHMYTKCGSLSDAVMVFHRLPRRDKITWSALLAGYVHEGAGEEALELWEKMEHEGLHPDDTTFVQLLNACSSISALESGHQIHARLTMIGVGFDFFISSALIDMYGKCCRVEDAHFLFNRLPMRNLITWSALIGGYARGHGETSLQLFAQMQSEGLEPDKVMLVSLLQACSDIGAFEEGRIIHAYVVEYGVEGDLTTSNVLIDMYGKCASLEDAHAIFDSILERDVVSWTALLEGYTLHEHQLDAFSLFEKMQKAHVEPNYVTYTFLTKACSSIAALEQGKAFHARIIEDGLESHLFVGSALVEMYSSCGCLEGADRLFDRLPLHDVVLWTALIGGYAQNNNYVKGEEYLESMLKEGFRPNGVTYLSLISACTRAGHVECGCALFKKMRDGLKVEPSLNHLNSLVDLLGQGGYLKEAEDLLETLCFESNVIGWTSLLSSCKRHYDTDIGGRCFEHLVACEEGSASPYALMSSVYAHKGMPHDAEKIELMRRCANLAKKPANAYVEVDNVVHEFKVGENDHPRIDTIRQEVKALSSQMIRQGYKPRLDLVVDAISDEEKKEVLFGHSEKLAIAFGLVSAPSGASLRVAKNLRMCTDCHNFATVLSKVKKREIYVKDAYCVHKFVDGGCICNGYS